jgi:hypothetical protein
LKRPIRAWLRNDVEGCVSLTGDDADELLPQVTKILTDALLQFVTRRDLEQQLDECLQVGQRHELPRRADTPGGVLV